MRKIILFLAGCLLLGGCYDSMEILQEEEIMALSSSSTNITISYELTADAYFEGGGITASAPVPNTVKDIIIHNFGQYGRVMSPLMYVTACRFTFSIEGWNGPIDYFTAEKAMRDAEWELEFKYGVTFFRYTIEGVENGSFGGGSSGSGGLSGGAGGGSGNSGSSSGNNPSEPESEPVPIIDTEGINNDTILDIYRDFL